MLISIGLPVYKSQYLSLAIKSILNQTYSDFELLILNDASPNPVEKIIGDFHDPRIKYFANETNLGKYDLAACWNLILGKAAGKYFVLASDDDYYEPTFLEKMVNKSIQFPEVDIFHCRLRIVDENEETVDISATCNEQEDVLDYMWHRLLKNRNQMVIEFMFKTTKLIQIGGFYSMPVGWGSDDITCYRLAKDNRIVFINELLCNWRKSGSNISTSHEFYYQKMMAIIKYKEWIKDFLSTPEFKNSDNKFLSELNMKTENEFYFRLCETATRFIVYSPLQKIPRNIYLCKKKFKVKIVNILGSLLEFIGKKLKNKI